MAGADATLIEVAIAADATSAELVIPGAFPREGLNAQVCINALKEQGVEVGNDVVQAVEKLLAEDANDGSTLRGVVARSVEPRDGKDGYVEWTIDGKSSVDEHVNKASYYEQSSFVMVKPGQVVGVIHRSTNGSDGRDVRGNTIAAKQGKAADVKHDETILVNSKGEVIAQDEGVLVRKDGRVSVRQVIEVTEYVDFSTGNIDFTGDVIVHKGVRDCFVVKATGNVEVSGLIEAATIDCGGNLVAHGGFAGRERGHAHVRGDLSGKYLDNIEGQVHGDLKIDREVINCDLTVHGGVDMPHGAIIGGNLAVTRAVLVGTVGSGAGVPTRLRLGSVPKLEPLLRKLEDGLPQLEEKLTEMLREKNRLDLAAKAKRLTANDKELQTEIMFELEPLIKRVARGKMAQTRLVERIEQMRTIELNVQRKLNFGTVVEVGESAYRITDECRGPVKVYKKGREMLYRRGDSKAQPLAQIADVSVQGGATAINESLARR